MGHAFELPPDAASPSPPPIDPSSAFLTAGGEMGARMRRRDWAGTPLGRIETWPQSLRAAVSIILSSRYPMFVWWGPGLVNLYNDAYRPFLGQKHPNALGQSARDVWAEIWDKIGPRTDAVLRRGEATFDECLLLPMDRHGYLEETYFTFSYSPIRDDDGAVGGIFCAVTEETSQVIGERRLKLLREVGASAAQTHSATQVCAAAAAAIAGEQRDLPVALLYLTEDAGSTARLAARAGIGAGDPAAPETIDLRAPDLHEPGPAWPLAQAALANEPLRVDASRRDFSRLPSGAWDRPPYAAAIMPLADRGTAGVAGFLVAGLNPYLMFDDSYRGFIGLLGGQIAAGIANARAYEEERKRAEALAEIDRAKTAFFSNVSHEFRTPLTLMLGPLEDVLNDPAPLPDAHRANLETAHRNSLRLLRLVNTLLDFSRIEAGRLQASYAPTDLATLTTDVASGFRSATERAGLALDIDCAPLREPVHVDREMWEKVVLNLLSNAFKFTFTGGIAVTLKARGENAVLEVRDTGVGIPAHELPRLFERFHRIEGQRSRSFEGSGIGLALVHELVRLHGGAITAQSGEGRGTTFTVAIPFGTAHLPAEHLADPPAPVAAEKRVAAYVEEALRWLPEGASEPAAPDAAPRATVLIADDNADMRQYVSRLLRGRYAIAEAADGETALAAARRLRPDLVLSDVMMPRLDGYGLLQAIRADPLLREVPVILLSARAGEEARAGGLEAGADDYIVKPFSARELVARVNAHLTLAGLRREATQALRETNEKLEARVAERTAELRQALQRLEAEMLERARMQEALRQAQKMEAIGQLTGGIAHDFNNLLTVIMGSAERIQQALPADNRRLHRDAEMVMHGSRRAAALTHKLLAFSRRQPLDPQPTDLNRLVSETAALLHRTLGETIELEGILAPHLWTVDVDRNQFENALLNLAVNSRDAMPEGGTLTIETRNVSLSDADVEAAPELQPGDYVLVAVGDTGHGVPPDVVDRVFDPFFTTKDPGRGTGLGLSQVYGFIKQSGGHVRLESKPGRGTTVRLYLPRHAGESLDSGSGPADAAALRGNGEMILVVEDDDQVRANTVEMLRDLGYQVLEAADAAMALRIGQGAEAIALLFTDVVLPGKCSGRQLAELLTPSRPDMKVLYTTGYARDVIVHNGRLDAGIALITKPFLMHELAAKVWSLLNE